MANEIVAFVDVSSTGNYVLIINPLNSGEAWDRVALAWATKSRTTANQQIALTSPGIAEGSSFETQRADLPSGLDIASEYEYSIYDSSDDYQGTGRYKPYSGYNDLKFIPGFSRFQFAVGGIPAGVAFGTYYVAFTRVNAGVAQTWNHTTGAWVNTTLPASGWSNYRLGTSIDATSVAFWAVDAGGPTDTGLVRAHIYGDFAHPARGWLGYVDAYFDGSVWRSVADLALTNIITTMPDKMLAYTQLMSRSDAAIKTDRATELTAINGDEGSGAGDYDPNTRALEALAGMTDVSAAVVSATNFGPSNQDLVDDSMKIVLVPQASEMLSHGSDPIELILGDSYGTQVGDEDVLVSVDFIKAIGSRNRLHSISSITQISGTDGGITVEEVGIDHTEAKFKLTPVTAGTYVFLIRVRLAGSNHYRTGKFTVLVIDPADTYGT